MVVPVPPGDWVEKPDGGMTRPEPHPDVTINRHRSVRLARFLRRRNRRPSGMRAASHSVLCGAGAAGYIDAVLTPVRTVTETVVVLPSAMLAGVMLQVALAGVPVQVKVAVPGMMAAELSRSG